MRLRIWSMLLKYVTCVVHAPCTGAMPHILDMEHLLVVNGTQMQVVVGPNEA